MTRPNFSVSLPGRYYRKIPGVDSGTWYNANDAHFCSEVISGVHRHKPQGWVPPTGYSFSRKEYNRQYGTYDVSIVQGNSSYYSGDIACGGAPFNGLNHFDAALSEATANTPLGTSASLVAARNNLKGMRVDLGVAFAERKETTRMLTDTTNRIVRSVRNLQRGNFRNAARDLGIVKDPGRPRGSNWINHWLQLQYGWRPLLSDVYGSCDALSKRPQSDWRVTSKGQRNDSDSWIYKKTPIGGSYPTGNLDAFQCTVRRRRGVFTRIDAIPQNDLTMSLVSLGVTNPLLIAWERVPYSFVVDWAFPVGQWLSSLDALLGYGASWHSVTTYNQTVWEEVGVSKEFGSKYSYVRNDWKGNKKLTRVVRTASSGVPLPAFPRFKDPGSLGHMANGLSLLAQVFGRSKAMNIS